MIHVCIVRHLHSIISVTPLYNSFLWVTRCSANLTKTFLRMLCVYYCVALCLLKWDWNFLKRGCLPQPFFFLTSSLDHYIDILAVSYQQKLIVRKHYSESCKDWLLCLGGQKPHTEQRMQNKKNNKRADHWKRHFSLCINMLIKWKQRFYMKMSLYYFSIILLS